MAARKPRDTTQTSNVVTFQELGSTGLKIQSGVVDEEFLPALRALPNRVEVFRQMKNDGVVGAVLFAIKMLIRGVDWVVKPATSEPADIPAAEHVKSCLYDMRESWDTAVDQILSFLTYGFSVHELVYKRRRGRNQKGSLASTHDDNLVGWLDIPVRGQETISGWEYGTASGDLEYVKQIALPDLRERMIPEIKLVAFRATSEKSNPEGESILRSAYIPWYYKARIQKTEGIGIERNLAGLPYANVPTDYLTNQEYAQALSQIKTLLRNIRNDERAAAVFPLAYDENGNKLFEFGLMTGSTRSTVDTNPVIMRYSQEIAMSVMADFILVGHEKAGSWSLHSDKTKLFATAIGAFIEVICQAFNRTAIPRLIDMNPFDVRRGYPTLDHGDIESIDLDAVTRFVTALAGAGMPLFPDEGLEQWARTRGGMPEITEEMLRQRTKQREAQAQPQPPPGQGEGEDKTPGRESGFGVSEGIQSKLLNGAQIAAIVQVATAAKVGDLDRTAAVNILKVAFGFNQATAESLVPTA